MSSLIVEVCKVEEIFKHPNADKLSVVKIKDWNCIVGLDQYKVGDLVVFIPPDCILPADLIEKYNLDYVKHNGRTGTLKLRGYVSQGLVLNLPEGKWKIGDDVSQKLNITKWMPPEPKYSVRGANNVSRKKLNPSFDKYTDIENIKNYPNIFNDGDMVAVSEKIHGSNARFGNLKLYIGKGQPFFERLIRTIKVVLLGHTHEFVWGSHNVQIGTFANRKSYYGTDIWGTMAKRYNLDKIIPKDYVVYAEIFGKGIQDLTYGLKDIEFRVFDVKYKDKYLDYDGFLEFCQELNLPIVPVIFVGEYRKELVQSWTTGQSIVYPEQIREGCVIKSYSEQNHHAIGRKILKSINPDYLLRKNGTEYQ